MLSGFNTNFPVPSKLAISKFPWVGELPVAFHGFSRQSLTMLESESMTEAFWANSIWNKSCGCIDSYTAKRLRSLSVDLDFNANQPLAFRAWNSTSKSAADILMFLLYLKPLPQKGSLSPISHLHTIISKCHTPMRPTPPSAPSSPHQCLTIPYPARSAIRLQTHQSSTRLPQHTTNPTRKTALERF